MPDSSPAASTVREFLAVLEDLDVDRLITYVHPDIVFENVSLPTVRGAVAVERVMRQTQRLVSRVELRIHNLAADGAIVLTERTDVVEIGLFRAEFWVCSTFEVRDGRIVRWRERFDWGNLLLAGAEGAAMAAVVGVRKLLNRRS